MARNSNKNGSAQTNRLLGWLVSYNLEELGASFEIRSGRTFITTGSGSEKYGISYTRKGAVDPAFVLLATPGKGVVAQDIFSENGSSVIKAGRKEETKIEGPVKLEHGDWITLGGDTRFQLCLVDGGNN